MRPEPQLLTEIVSGIADTLRRYVGALWIERDADGGDAWHVRVTYSLMVSAYPGEIADAGPYQIGADLRDLPRGVSVAWDQVRYPDSRHPLLVWGDDPTPHIMQQVRALHESGVVGGLDAAIHHWPTGDRWLVKTHAGSDAERAAWVRSI